MNGGVWYMEEIRARISEGGRISLPATYRRALGINIGDDVILRLEDGEVRIFTLQHAIQHAQELVRTYLGEGRSLSEELIAERREEAAHE
jgi:AbrB family looped-hinge helix DNA binding protein